MHDKGAVRSFPVNKLSKRADIVMMMARVLTGKRMVSGVLGHLG